MTRTNENGIAMILALFMVLTMSILASSLMFVSQTETWSSLNYRLMSQSRYGAEAGVHSAANYLVKTYAPPTAGGADPIASYNVTVSPVTYNGQPVVLSSNPAVASNYPVAAVTNAFNAATQGSLNMNNGSVTYNASATLLSMQQVTDSFSGLTTAIQTWQVTADGTTPGTRSSQVEVSAVIERQVTPVFTYAAFGTYNGCGALSLSGGGSTDSYDSSAALVGGSPVISNSGGNVGTNGNLADSGNATVNGSLSTPRSGVGACTANNVTAETLSGGATVTGGLNELSQPVTYQTPALPSPMPPTTDFGVTKSSGCGGVANCVPSANGVTLTAGSFGNIHMTGGAVVHITAGTYAVNSFDLAGNSSLVIDSGPVVFKIGGKAGDGTELVTPLDFTGGSAINATFDPSKVEFLYAGTGAIKMSGGAQNAATIYAPNATAALTGGSDFYGALIVQKLTDTGGVHIHYDRHLSATSVTVGNPMMSSFTWKSY